jgi:hypothetical protein
VTAVGFTSTGKESVILLINTPLTQAEIAATVAELLGKDFRKAVPEAAPPITDVISQPPK